MQTQTNHFALTLLLLLTLFIVATPLGRHLVKAQHQDYKTGDVVEVKWLEDWVIAKVDKCLNASTCMVYFYDARTEKYDTRSTAIMTDHIRTTVNRPPTKPDTFKQRKR